MNPMFSSSLNYHARKGFFSAIDKGLLFGISMLVALGLVILYSASSENFNLVKKQMLHVALSASLMIVMAHISPLQYKRLGPWLYGVGLILLILVLVMGQISKGAQRWLHLGLFRFQPSELMKIATPLMIASFLDNKTLPIAWKDLLICVVLVTMPGLLIMVQPDLGTAVLIMASGFAVIFFAGISWKIIFGMMGLLSMAMPVLWLKMHDYQRQRVLTFLDPEQDPLGSGYHIIQSKIAIGSGGVWGKGWLQGTQTQLDFLPEHNTDFIFSVLSEEFGLMGISALLLIYFFVLARGFYIALNANDTFSRLCAGGLITTFFVYVFVNMGMVSGLLPVVGVPLPLISYGGTSMITLMASFGVLMSISAQRSVWRK
jgi:rod shape determining protein RodA